MSNTELLINFISKHRTDFRSPHEQMVHWAKTVAEMPWGEARTVQDVISLNKGTCHGKHKVLQAIFDYENIPYRTVVCTFRWNAQNLKLPNHLSEMLASGPIWNHGHNFVQVSHNSEWIDLDVTWNSKLNSYGFKSLPDDWNGETSFIGLSKIEQRWDGADIDDMKKGFIEGLEPSVRAHREKFLHGLIAWIDGINSNKI